MSLLRFKAMLVRSPRSNKKWTENAPLGSSYAYLGQGEGLRENDRKASRSCRKFQKTVWILRHSAVTLICSK